MKKSYIILITITAFIFGVMSFYLYELKNNSFRTAGVQVDMGQSGRFEKLQFEKLVKAGDTYRIKFSRQIEPKPVSTDCAADGSDDEIKQGCNPVGLYQTRINPEIDLSKEYEFTNFGTVTLISYDIFQDSWNESIHVDSFYKYINKSEKPKVQYYGDPTVNPANTKYNVIMMDGKIVNISQVYEQ